MSKHFCLRQNLDKNFVELARMLDLEPALDFKGCILADLDLRGLDLRSFNFSGADMRGCLWDDAQIATTVFDGDSVVDRAAIAKARDAADNPLLRQGLAFVTTSRRAALLALCARVLRIDWLLPGRFADAAEDDLRNLLEVIEREGEGVTQDQRYPLSDDVLTNIERHLVNWREAHINHAMPEMAHSTRQIQYTINLIEMKHSRMLRVISIIQRLELHRLRANLNLSPSRESLISISTRLDQALTEEPFNEVDVISEILAHAVPPRHLKRLNVGIAFVGKVTSSDNIKGIKVFGLGRNFSLVDSLTSVAWYHQPPAVGSLGYFVTRGSGQITQRGSGFVSAVSAIYFPFDFDVTNPTELFMGASNSWAVIVTSPKKRGGFLGNGGELSKTIQSICGLQRVTITTRSQEREIEVKNFINDGYRDIQDLSIGDELVWGRLRDGQALRDHVNTGSTIYEERKVRTFLSMWIKVFPDLDIVVSIGETLGFSSRGFKKNRDDDK
jgi:hypothetical protein